MNFNDRLALFITKRIGSMGAAYLFTVLALVSLPAVIAANSVILWVSWITQTFLQLVLLPIIMVGQNLQGKKHDEALKHHKAHGEKLSEILRKVNAIHSRTTKR